MILENADISVQPKHESPDASSVFLCFRGEEVLLDAADGTPVLPAYSQVKPLLPEGARPFELAHANGSALFTLPPFGGGEARERGRLRYFPIGVFHEMDEVSGGVLTAAFHLWSWYGRNRFCGRCGQPMLPDEEERSLRCGACAQALYPSIAPAVIVAVTCGERILLAKNARGLFAHYGLVAGYVEVGETLEHAVRREVREEVGLTLRSLKYIADQPWGISGSLMFAFRAEAEEGQPIVLQRSELADARWFSRAELEPRSRSASIAFELIERFRTGML